MKQPAQRPHTSGFFDNLAGESSDEQTKKNVYGPYSDPNQSYQQYRNYHGSFGGMLAVFWLDGVLLVANNFVCAVFRYTIASRVGTRRE